MNSKTEFLENIFSPKYDYSKSFLLWKTAGTKNSQFKTWPFGNFPFQIFIVQENVCFRIWFFLFHKFHFKLWFSMKKFATKSCRLKSAGKMRNLFIVRGAYRVKTLFLKGDVFIEIRFLNEYWIQNLNFKNNPLSTKRLLEKLFRNPPGRKTLDSKTFRFVGKNFTSKFDFFFPKIPFQTLIFNEKACFKIMPFKISTKSENYVVFPGTNWVRIFFFRCELLIEIWFLNKNWTQ